jgi:hypothetical protein
LSEDPGLMVGFGTAVTVTATVSGAVATPTGVVSYTVDGGSAQSASLINGVAIFTLSNTIAQGTHPVVVSYGGDKTYTVASVSQGFTLTVAPGGATLPGFNVNASTATLTASHLGSDAGMTLTVTPTGGYTGALSFGCKGIPDGSACGFKDLNAPFSRSQAPHPVQFDVITNSNMSLQRMRKNSPVLAGILFGIPGLAAIFLHRKRPKNLLGRYITLFLLFCGTWMMVGCKWTISSGNYRPAPLAADGTYLVQASITGDSGFTQTINVSLTVQ